MGQEASSRPGSGPPARDDVSGEVPDDVIGRLSGRQTSVRRYRVEGEVARGGMGAVLRVWDEDLRRALAMKVVLGKSDAASTGATPPVEPHVLARFLEEAQITSQLDHPGIVPVHEIGLDPHGRVFFTMRLVAGRDLEHIFGLVRRGEQGWSVTRAVGVVLKVCEAAAYAHSKGVVHRDLKPANVMVGSFGEVYVMDWGLARVLGAPTRERASVTAAGAVKTDRQEARDSVAGTAMATLDGDIVGTPAYMSPEQARGDLAAVGPRSDVYSAGAMLYHLLAGHMPYVPPGAPAGVVEAWRRARDGPPEPLHLRAPAAPAELVAICERSMARDAADRYASMEDLAGDLRAYLEGRVVSAYETGALAEFRKWVRRNKALALTGIASVTLITAGSVAASIVLARKEREAQRNATLAAERADRILRLSDIRRLLELETLAVDLWPALPATIPRLEAWIAQARELLGRLPGHRAALDELRSRSSPQGREAGEWRFDTAEDRWQHDTQEELVAGLDAFGRAGEGLLPDVERRLEFARTVEERTVTGEEARRRWEEARRSVADPGECPAYGGLVLVPRLGLLPIGRDPASGLWEFAHLQTGEVTVRDDASGELRLTEDSGLVLVLVPGGEFVMGAQSVDPDAEAYDLHAQEDEAPAHEVRLAPFYVSKYEMTQGQWMRVTGLNPSLYGPDREVGGARLSLLHPVEQVSWDECTLVLSRVGLVLPTEAQWEWAARAGTGTAWWTGDEWSSLAGAANIADETARRYSAPWPGVRDAPGFDDGWLAHAPVDRFAANPYGLHGVIGNVWEWCRDAYGLYDALPRTGDEERRGAEARLRVNRGGSYSHGPFEARSTNRNNTTRDEGRFNNLGLRPSLPVQDAD